MSSYSGYATCPACGAFAHFFMKDETEYDASNNPFSWNSIDYRESDNYCIANHKNICCPVCGWKGYITDKFFLTSFGEFHKYSSGFDHGHGIYKTDFQAYGKLKPDMDWPGGGHGNFEYETWYNKDSSLRMRISKSFLDSGKFYPNNIVCHDNKYYLTHCSGCERLSDVDLDELYKWFKPEFLSEKHPKFEPTIPGQYGIEIKVEFVD